MKTVHHIKLSYQSFQLIITAIFLGFLTGTAYTYVPVLGYYGPTNTPLDSWSFEGQHRLDASDFGYAPVSYTRTSISPIVGTTGNGSRWSCVWTPTCPRVAAIQCL